ncbi:serine/threonine-protein kinase [Streptomyces sp. NPDC001941]|uniref:serine/threonine-protein kinase n=1 Tax=Streptomyces sp. NPDC001941 TaxID=3154659 RepID=UPI00332AAD2D
MGAPGDVIDGRFELLARLGSGGMGTVWRARDTVLHREVALKEVRTDLGPAGADARERVLREARALARLSHPHVVTVHHVVDTGPHPWIVMELLPGTTLEDRLARGPLAPPEAARLGRQLLSALSAAHAAGILHRDVKPANVLLRPDGGAVLTDFGIAALQGSTALTEPGTLIGSPEYIAPERVRGTGDAPPADLWSLGLVLYVCVEGVSPLRRATTLATLAAVLDDPVPPPVRSGPLSPVLAELLVRDPAARPGAARLDVLLARVEAGQAVPEWEQGTRTAVRPEARTPTARVAVPSGPTTPTAAVRPARGRAPVVAAVAVAVALVAAATLVLALREPGGGGAAGGTGTSAAVPPPVTSATASPSPSAPSSAPPSPSASSEAPAPPPSARAATSEPPRAEDPAPAAGRWIAQLYSEPVSSGTAARDRRLASVRESVPEAEYLRSNDYASLRPGYWVVYAPGPFADGREALEFCAGRGRTSANSCIGRYLSTRGSDLVLQCRPPAGAPSGRCTRDG